MIQFVIEIIYESGEIIREVVWTREEAIDRAEYFVKHCWKEDGQVEIILTEIERNTTGQILSSNEFATYMVKDGKVI